MHWFKKLIFLVSVICASALFYFWYGEQKNNRLLLDKLKIELEKDRSISAKLVTTHKAPCQNGGWGAVQEDAHNAVLQVFVHRAQFNWIEPYKTPQQEIASGSGFFIDDDGHLITNAHVVDEYRAVYIQIPFFGKRRFDVEVLGVSPERDLALLKVIPDDLAIIKEGLGSLPLLKFGDSDGVRRADEIMTLGFPLGQQFLKSTVGVVSGLQHIGGRSMFQIDAPINPGNSGGPSLNKQGLVIGVNTSRISGSGTQNVAYIIPSNEAQLFLKQLKDIPEMYGVKFLRKPILGISYNTATDTVARFFGNPPTGGIYVVDVYRDSPLDKAGVLPGDMIYEIDGHQIDYFGEIQVRWSEDRVSVLDYVSRLIPGDEIHIVVYRNGVRHELVAHFDFTNVLPVRMMYPGYEPIEYEIIGGLIVMPLALNHIPLFLKINPELARFVELDEQQEPHLIITHILPDSSASRTRALHPSMLLDEVNGKKTRTIEEFRTHAAESLETGYLTLKTDEKVFTVLPFDKVLREERKLSGIYFYTPSPFTKGLIDKMGVIA